MLGRLSVFDTVDEDCVERSMSKDYSLDLSHLVNCRPLAKTALKQILNSIITNKRNE